METFEALLRNIILLGLNFKIHGLLLIQDSILFGSWLNIQ